MLMNLTFFIKAWVYLCSLLAYTAAQPTTLGCTSEHKTWKMVSHQRSANFLVRAQSLYVRATITLCLFEESTHQCLNSNAIEAVTAYRQVAASTCIIIVNLAAWCVWLNCTSNSVDRRNFCGNHTYRGCRTQHSTIVAHLSCVHGFNTMN